MLRLRHLIYYRAKSKYLTMLEVEPKFGLIVSLYLAACDYKNNSNHFKKRGTLFLCNSVSTENNYRKHVPEIY